MKKTIPKKNVAVLVSGNGSNLQSIINKVKSGYLRVNLAVIISNKDGVKALDRAKKHKIPFYFVDHRGIEREEHEKKVIEILKRYNIDLVVLAGYMRLLTSFFLDQYSNKVINIHPSLLPAFPGTSGYEDAYRYGVKISGCTVHFVDSGMDTGQIILQKVNYLKENDTLESFKKRGLRIEHEALPEAIKMWSDGKIKIKPKRQVS